MNDYKLFRFLELDGGNNVGMYTKADVLSLRTGHWKEVKNVPECDSWDHSVVVKGVWYQLALGFDTYEVDKEMQFILSCDVHNEFLRKTELPDGCYPQMICNLIVYIESLATVAFKKYAITYGL